MPGNFSTTARNALRYLLGTSKVSDVDEGFQRLAEDVDTKMMSYWMGTLAARPAAGQPNRIYKATDTNELFHDTGTVWEPLYSITGLPAAAVARTSGVEYEPSATRPVLVAVEVAKAGGSEEYTAVEIVCGGIVVQGAAGKLLTGSGALGVLTPPSFIVPPGQKWKATVTGGAGTNIASTYQTL